MASQANYTVYHIRGKDSLGEIHIERRFSEFLVLRDFLFKRYPGLYIPPVPEKNFSGKNKTGLIEERKYQLDMFLQNICQHTYLAGTPEL